VKIANQYSIDITMHGLQKVKIIETIAAAKGVSIEKVVAACFKLSDTEVPEVLVAALARQNAATPVVESTEVMAESTEEVESMEADSDSMEADAEVESMDSAEEESESMEVAGDEIISSTPEVVSVEVVTDNPFLSSTAAVARIEQQVQSANSDLDDLL
jgi:hypothetical protein